VSDADPLYQSIKGIAESLLRSRSRDTCAA
jgi:hypothetical protein